jgi:hypothetical protein
MAGFFKTEVVKEFPLKTAILQAVALSVSLPLDKYMRIGYTGRELGMVGR